MISSPPRHARFWLVISTWIFALAFQYAYVETVIPEWEYLGFGFSYREPGFYELSVVFSFVTVGALLMPTMLSRASSIILLLLYQMVYLPGIIVTMNLDTDRDYVPLLAALVIGFSIACLAGRKHRLAPSSEGLPTTGLLFFVTIFWAVCFALILVSSWNILSFVGLGDIYVQRELGAAPNVLIAYTHTYLGNVTSPALIAIGLTRRAHWATALGLIGCLLIYSVTAQRTVFLLPLALFALHFLLRRKLPKYQTTALPMLAVALLIFVASFFSTSSTAAQLICTYFTGRTIAIPGLTLSVFYNVFTTEGFTWWSHIKGLSLLISPPPVLGTDPNWPALGWVVGARISKSADLDFNANLFSSDGVAAAGALGVVVMGAVLAFWIWLLDKVSATWNRNFVILSIFPFALTLTNAQLSTAILSFGGLFWLLILAFWKTSEQKLVHQAHPTLVG
jgi:hypothetical protein